MSYLKLTPIFISFFFLIFFPTYCQTNVCKFLDLSEGESGIVDVKITRIVKVANCPFILGEADGITFHIFPWDEDKEEFGEYQNRRKIEKELLSLKIGKTYPLLVKLDRREAWTFIVHDEFTNNKVFLTGPICSVKLI